MTLDTLGLGERFKKTLKMLKTLEEEGLSG